MGLLNKELNRKYRAIYGEYIINHPTDEQYLKIKEMFTSTATIDNSLTINGTMSEELIRYMFKELTNVGEEIETISGEELDYLTKNGTREFKKTFRELKELIIEIAEESQDEMYDAINVISGYSNVIKSNLEFDKVKKNMDKMLKKQGIDLDFEEFLALSNNPEELQERMSSSKKKKVVKKK